MEYKKIFIERILGTALKSPIISAKIFICSITTEIQMVIYGRPHMPAGFSEYVGVKAYLRQAPL